MQWVLVLVLVLNLNLVLALDLTLAMIEAAPGEVNMGIEDMLQAVEVAIHLARKSAAVLRRGSLNHQGVIARYAGYAYADLNEILARAIKANEPAFILVLDVVQDVQNLGSLIRSAEAVGAHGVLIADRGAAGVTPAVRKASAGAVAHMAIARLDLVEALDQLKARGVTVCGLDGSGDRAPWECDLKVPLACVVGSEGRGQRDVISRRCDQLLGLPMRGQLGSLNASVAGSILLYEVQRQRGAAGGSLNPLP